MTVDKIYDDAADVHVANYLLYAKKGDTKLYADAAMKTQATATQAVNCFKKGCLIGYDNGFYKPFCMTIAESVAKVSIVVAGTAAAGTTPGNVLEFVSVKDA